MKTIMLAFACLLSLSTFAAGFSAGNVFTTLTLEGRLSVQCFGSGPGSSYGTSFCSAQVLDPGEYSYFVGPKIDADKITLQALWENGQSSKKKTEQYDATTGRSKKPFNLWISTVFQRPLLDFGKNIINYSLTKDGVVVEEGNFVVEVVKGTYRVCPRDGFYTSSTSNDCTFPSGLCYRYFSDYNYCR